MPNHYEILGIQRNATQDEVKSAYKKQATKYHPDKNKTPEAAAQLKKIKEAYDVLGAVLSRDAYNRELAFANRRIIITMPHDEIALMQFLLGIDDEDNRVAEKVDLIVKNPNAIANILNTNKARENLTALLNKVLDRSTQKGNRLSYLKRVYGSLMKLLPTIPLEDWSALTNLINAIESIAKPITMPSDDFALVKFFTGVDDDANRVAEKAEFIVKHLTEFASKINTNEAGEKLTASLNKALDRSTQKENRLLYLKRMYDALIRLLPTISSETQPALTNIIKAIESIAKPITMPNDDFALVKFLTGVDDDSSRVAEKAEFIVKHLTEFASKINTNEAGEKLTASLNKALDRSTQKENRLLYLKRMYDSLMRLLPTISSENQPALTSLIKAIESIAKPITMPSDDFALVKFLTGVDDDSSRVAEKAEFIVNHRTEFASKINTNEAGKELTASLNKALDGSTQKENRLSYLNEMHTALIRLLPTIDNEDKSALRTIINVIESSLPVQKTMEFTLPGEKEDLAKLFLGDETKVNDKEIAVKARYIVKHLDALTRQIIQLLKDDNPQAAFNTRLDTFLSKTLINYKQQQYLVEVKQELEKLNVDSNRLKHTHNCSSALYQPPSIEPSTLEKLITAIDTVLSRASLPNVNRKNNG